MKKNFRLHSLYETCRSLFFIFFVIFLFTGITPRLALASGIPGHLDAFCRDAEYIVIGTCTSTIHDNWIHKAQLKVEKIFKSPHDQPKPTSLDIKGHCGTGSRFRFQKEKRFFVFVFKDTFQDLHNGRMGSILEIDSNEKLYPMRELICLAPQPVNVKQLSTQVEYILSGKYEQELLETVSNTKQNLIQRTMAAKSLIRFAPEKAIEPTSDLILEMANISQKTRDTFFDKTAKDGTATKFVNEGRLYWYLLLVDPDATRDLAFQALQKTESWWSAEPAAIILSHPHCKFRDKGKSYPTLLKLAEKWKTVQHAGPPITGSMLKVFANNQYRTDEVRELLLEQLSQDEIIYRDRLCAATLGLQFPESTLAFWKLLKETPKKYRKEISLITQYNADNTNKWFWKQPLAEAHTEKTAKDTIFATFPEVKNRLTDEPPIALQSGMLFLTKPDKNGHQACILAGWKHTGPGKTNSFLVPRAFLVLGTID